jgi:hypothetical protein
MSDCSNCGPGLGIGANGLNGASIKPYVVATGALLADAPYYGGLGGGLTAHLNAGNVALDPFVEIIQQSYRNSALYPLASGLSGTLANYALQASGPIYGGLGWQSRLTFAHAQNDFEPYSYNRYSGDIWLPWYFSVPGTAKNWSLTPTFGVSRWQYKAPDPTIDPATTRRDLEWRAGVGLNVPIREQFNLALLVQYRAISSNEQIFSMKDLSFTFGPSLQF